MVAILLSSPGSYRREYVEALDFLANLSSRMENVSDAIKYCESELALLDELGSTEAARVRNQIEALRGELETFCEFETVLLDDIGRVNLRRNRSARRLTEGLGSPFASEMVAIPGGTFTMGSPTEEEGSSEEERPQHEVTISPFSIGKFPVTQAQWRAVARWEKVERELNADPSHFKGDDRPVEQVSWEEATEFCLRVSKRLVRHIACQLKRNGSTRAGPGRRRRSHLGRRSLRNSSTMMGTILMQRRRKGGTAKRRFRWAVLAWRMRGGCTICTATCGSGVRIGPGPI